MSENGPYLHISAQPVVVVSDTWLLIGGAQWKECRPRAFGCRFVHSVGAVRCSFLFYFYNQKKRYCFTSLAFIHSEDAVECYLSVQ